MGFNEKELVLTALIYELWLLAFDEFDDSEIVTVKYNDDTLISKYRRDTSTIQTILTLNDETLYK